MRSNNLKCKYLMDEIALLEVEKDNLLIYLREDTTESETRRTVSRLVKIDSDLDRLREISLKMVCKVNNIKRYVPRNKKTRPRA